MKSSLRVGIVGSRRRCSLTDRKIVFGLVEKLIRTYPQREITIVSGACRLGADSFAAEAAQLYGLKLLEFPVPKKDYAHRGEYREAAFDRNRLIAENSEMGFALVTRDRTGGTENTVEHYRKLRKRIILIDDVGRAYLSPSEESDRFDVKEDSDKG